MTAKAAEWKSRLVKLSPEDRAALAHFLIESLDHEKDAAVEAAWDEELKRRADEIRSGEMVGEPAAQVFRELRAKYS